MLERLEQDGAFVPHLWRLEVRNALLIAERRSRLPVGTVNERLDSLRRLPIRTDEEPDLESAFDLARAHGLSFYDALYLELSKRQNAELATLDRALDRAASAEGVALSGA